MFVTQTIIPLQNKHIFKALNKRRHLRSIFRNYLALEWLICIVIEFSAHQWLAADSLAGWRAPSCRGSLWGSPLAPPGGPPGAQIGSQR